MLGTLALTVAAGAQPRRPDADLRALLWVRRRAQSSPACCSSPRVAAAASCSSRARCSTSTPSAYTGLTVPLPLPAGAEACADETVFDDRHADRPLRRRASRQARRPRRRCEVTARGYSDAQHGRVPQRLPLQRRASRAAGRARARSTCRSTPPAHRRLRVRCASRNLGQQVDRPGRQPGRPRLLAPDRARRTASPTRDRAAVPAAGARQAQPARRAPGRRPRTPRR